MVVTDFFAQWDSNKISEAILAALAYTLDSLSDILAISAHTKAISAKTFNKLQIARPWKHKPAQLNI